MESDTPQALSRHLSPQNRIFLFIYISFHTRWVQCGRNVLVASWDAGAALLCEDLLCGPKRVDHVLRVYTEIVETWKHLLCTSCVRGLVISSNPMQRLLSMGSCTETCSCVQGHWWKASYAFFFFLSLSFLDIEHYFLPFKLPALVVPDRWKKVQVVHWLCSRRNMTDFLYFQFHVFFFFIRKEQSVWFPAQIVILTTLSFFSSGF